MIMCHWIRLSLLCRCKWTRKSQVWYGNFPEQHLLCKNKKVYCVYRRNLLCKKFVKKVTILVLAQDSCACTTLLRMHNTLVHALEGPGTKAGTQKKAPPRVVHAQECCACTRILCMHKNLGPHNLISSRSVFLLSHEFWMPKNIIILTYEKVGVFIWPKHYQVGASFLVPGSLNL